MNVAKTIARACAYAGVPIGGFMRGIMAGAGSDLYEGTRRDRFRDRPPIRLASQDADSNWGTREEMVSEVRNLENNFPIVGEILEQYAVYCVGSCDIKWDTGDKVIDKLYQDNWKRRMLTIDANGVHTFPKLTEQVVIAQIASGDVFGQKVRAFDEGKIRLIEGDRVQNGYGAPANIDTEDMVGGIKLDENGMRVSARVWERQRHYGLFKNPKDIPWAELFYIADPKRIDAIRDVTKFKSVLNKIRDFKETTNAELLSAKRNSKLALLVKSIMGGAGANAGVDLFSDDTRSGSTRDSTPDNKVNIQRVNDTVDAYMFPNEEMKAHTSERPSEGWRWLMEFIVREIAIGLHLPFGVVWNMAGLGGPAARFEISRANRTFYKYLKNVLHPKWIKPVAGWVTAEDIEKEILPFHPNWSKFTPHIPSRITIDLGRDSKAGIEENKMGLLTATEWYAEDDKDFEAETERLAQEASFRNEMVAKYPGIKLEDIRLTTPNGNPAQAGKDNQKQPEMETVNE